MDSHSTALILFARNASAESCHKELLSDPNKNVKLHQKLIDHVESIACSLAMPFFHIDETRQQGETFGRRFSSAIESVFNNGYERVIVIGSDCPDINQLDILRAAKLLDESCLIAGPDQRGGAYLIGLNRKVYNGDLLEKLPWQTSQLLDALCMSFASHGLLEKKNDINEIEDVVRSTSAVLYQVLLKTFDHQTVPPKNHDLFYWFQNSPTTSRRGPPVAA